MNIDELKNLIGTLSKGELETIKAAIEQQSRGAEIVDTIKNVFNSGHIIELLVETASGDVRIYTDDFISAIPHPGNNIEIVLRLVNGGEISFVLDTGTNWCFSKTMPYYNIMSGRPQIKNIGFLKSLIVCFINRGTFNTANNTPMDFIITEKFNDIMHDRVKEQVSSEKAVTADTSVSDDSFDESSGENDILQTTLAAVEKWINDETVKRHLIVEVDQNSSHKNGNSSVTRRNLYTLSFQKMSLGDNLSSVTFYTSADKNCKNTYSPNLLPFVDGVCYWDKKAEQLVIKNQDDTHTIKIRFMNPDGTYANNEILPDDISIKL